MADLLAIEGLSAGYGRAVVLSDVSLRLAEGEALAVLGRNGVGKTTLIDSIVGVTRRISGSILLGGRDIAALPPEQRAALGVGWVPQERNIFRGEHHGRGPARSVVAAARVRFLPSAEGTATPGGQLSVRRRAADAGDRPRACDQSAPVAPR